MNFWTLDEAKCSCAKGEKAEICAACYKPFKPVSISPFEFRCFPDPNDPDAGQESARQAEAAKTRSPRKRPRRNLTIPQIAWSSSGIPKSSGRTLTGSPLMSGPTFGEQLNCGMNVTMSPENFLFRESAGGCPNARQRRSILTACFAPQKPVFVGNGRYECRGKNPQRNAASPETLLKRRRGSRNPTAGLGDRARRPVGRFLQICQRRRMRRRRSGPLAPDGRHRLLLPSRGGRRSAGGGQSAGQHANDECDPPPVRSP